MRYMGHPFIDIGIATITAFAGVSDPSKLTNDDCGRIADFITREYVQQPLRSFLTVVFPNSGFTQSAFFNLPERQRDYADRVLRGFTEDAPILDELCVFTGDPAIAIAFGDKPGLPMGRAYRQHIPLITGENVINFHPYGDSGLPVSGKAMLAIQAFPLGCAKAGGRLLAVHSDNSELMLHFARAFLRQNRQLVQLAQANNDTKMPESPWKHKTLLIETLLEADLQRIEASEYEQPYTVTAYHLSNSGQGPGLDIYQLPMQTIAFLRDMESTAFRSEWHAIVHRAWDIPSTAKESANFQPSRNRIYEDLFDLDRHGSAARFIRTYFLRMSIRAARDKNDPRTGYSLQQESNLVSWKLTAQFLWRILNVDKERLDEIRQMGDRLAEYVFHENDRRFFQAFLTSRRYDEIRNALIKADIRTMQQGREPLLRLDPYVTVFEEGIDMARPDWRLARDLVLIRMVERLYELGWLKQNDEVMADVAATLDESE